MQCRLPFQHRLAKFGFYRNSLSILKATFASQQIELTELEELYYSNHQHIEYLDSQIAIKEDKLESFRDLIEESTEAQQRLASELKALAEEFMANFHNLSN